jgi:haloalkane dehalogenase
MRLTRFLRITSCALGISCAFCACQPSAHDPASKPMLNTPAATAASASASHPSSSSRRVAVLDSFMAVREVGSGPPIVFLHGNPLSSQVWHDVLPRLATRGRCLAPDLIGMGDSGKPDSAYRLEDHARYLDAWFEAMGLEEVVLVGYDWGGVLAMDWAARHPQRVRGLVVFETFLRPMTWSEWSPRGAELFRGLRTPGVGEKMVLESNQFLDRSLANGIKRPLTDAERTAYYAPYAEPASRRPILQWTREIPIEGEPADVQAIFARYDAWLAASPTIPKLLFSFDAPEGLQPSPTGSPPMIDWARSHVAGLEVTHLGTAGHHAPEDLPEPIATSIGDWLARHGL